MARLWYGGTPADFVVSQGAVAEVLDEEGEPTGDTGSAVLLPTEATGFTVYTDASLSTSTTDLLDASDSPIEEVVPETDYARRGGIPAFQGPDGHEGPVWLSADGENGYRLEPDSGSLYARVGDIEEGLYDLAVSDLEGWSEDSPTDGDVPRWNNSLGVWEPVAAGSGSGEVSSVNGEGPDGSGNVELSPSDVGAATADDMATVKSRVYIVCRPAGGGGYQSKSGWTNAIYTGSVQPSSGVSEYDLWIQPESA